VHRIHTFETSRTDLEPEPIDPTWIKEGNPVARAAKVAKSSDENLITGLWDCTAGKFKWIYWYDEIVQVLEGEARVHDGTKLHVLVPGTVVYFPSGLEADWEVPNYIKKTFILSAPRQSRLRRVASAIKRRLMG
jgi:uncharacterized protein